MGSEKKKLRQDEPKTPPKLSLLTISRGSMLPDLPTPPPRTAVSVPFEWEEAPGRPRPCHSGSRPKGNDDVARTLELPPRLVLLEGKDSSPTTVLDGPYVGRAMSFTTSCRPSKDTWNANFASNRWSALKKNEPEEGSFGFSSSTVEGTGKVKITRVRRKGSFSSLSHRSSHVWVSICETFKQVVPWKRRKEKQGKWMPQFDSI
ncbi:uncharacterized protein HKW66_Vig0177910 [Vigna angularis]|uniref:Uncharacterized protein n=2 Tax=Phaseolus angularis TaxID=3914 RepID=A0A8T0JY20_PHAAN|nr:uncharacterized protein LOC108337768 isoform X1 [Vigna angularis]KAG2389718.1 uncharacterized protein HKW66_Vig0177910 [Vigna angularis]BAT81930.1 hypothetical protein VIGAN_03184700 [Vigna angularis var. angularis]